jgi:hypothetical protein
MQYLPPRELANHEPWIDALVESIRDDSIWYYGEFANAWYGALVLLEITPFPHGKLAASFSGNDPQGDLVAVAILAARKPDAVTDAMIEFCIDQLSSDTVFLNENIAFHALKRAYPRSKAALRRALESDDLQQAALAIIALDERNALPGSLDSERLLDKMVTAKGPIYRFALPDAALVLAKRTKPWVRRKATSVEPGTTAERLFHVLLNPASDWTDIEVIYGGESVAYRKDVPLAFRLAGKLGIGCSPTRYRPTKDRYWSDWSDYDDLYFASSTWLLDWHWEWMPNRVAVRKGPLMWPPAD